MLNSEFSSVYLAQDDIDRPDERDDVGHQMAFHQTPESLQIAERRRPDAEPVRVRRLAVADDEEAELPFRRLDGVVRFPGRRLDQPRHLADNGSFRNAFRGLTDDAQRLAEFLHPDEIAIVGVPRG